MDTQRAKDDGSVYGMVLHNSDSETENDQEYHANPENYVRFEVDPRVIAAEVARRRSNESRSLAKNVATLHLSDPKNNPEPSPRNVRQAVESYKETISVYTVQDDTFFKHLISKIDQANIRLCGDINAIINDSFDAVPPEAAKSIHSHARVEKWDKAVTQAKLNELIKYDKIIIMPRFFEGRSEDVVVLARKEKTRACLTLVAVGVQLESASLVKGISQSSECLKNGNPFLILDEEINNKERVNFRKWMAHVVECLVNGKRTDVKSAQEGTLSVHFIKRAKRNDKSTNKIELETGSG